MNAPVERPDFSIITAVRNAKSTIVDCMRSIDAQRSVRVQHIIIDACSSDGTSELIEKQGRIDRIHVREGDRGISDAWNKGLKLCTGRYIGILSADDYYSADTLAKARSALDKDPRRMCYGDITLVPSNSPSGAKTYRGSFNSSTLFRGIGFWHPTLFGSREIFHKVGGFSLSYSIAADCDWILRAKSFGITFGRHNGAVFMRCGGVSDVQWMSGRCEYIAILESHPEFWLQALLARAWNQYLKVRRIIL